MKTIALLLLLSANAFAAEFKTQGGQVEFLAYTKPGHIKIAGIGNSPEGHLVSDKDTVHGEFRFALESLDTHISKRNEHMKDIYLQTAKFPTAELSLQSVKLDKPFDKAHPALKTTAFQGKLTLHGETKPVKGEFTIDEKGKVDAHFTVQLSVFRIEKPSFAGITVTDDIDVEVKIDQLI